MKVVQTDFPGLLILEPRVFGDERGFFLESYNKGRFLDLGIDTEFVQDNHAYSREAGVLRGFHFQAPPMAQSKLVWVTRGSVLDVVVDLRKGSPRYGKWFKTELSATNFRRLFVPKGFAHAYLTLEADCEFLYKVDADYSPQDEGGIAWDDSDLAVDWSGSLPKGGPILSEKDKALMKISEFNSPFIFDEE